MKINNLESYYEKIDKHIKLCEAYTEIKNLSKIIKMCRLIPYEKPQSKIKLSNHWIDEYGNSFFIKKNKKISIVYNDLDLGESHCTDLYRQLSIRQVIKMSKLIYISRSKTEIFIGLLGIDNYLRCYIINNNIGSISPLLLGQKRLQSILQHSDIKFFVDVKCREKFPLPVRLEKEWISALPISEKFDQQLNQYHIDLKKEINEY